MKTNYKKLFAALPFCLGALLMTACEQEDRTYQGPLYYEYSASECDQSNASNIFVKEAKSDGADQLCVQLIAPASGAVKVNFRVADQLFYLKSSAEYVTELPAGTTAGQYEAFVSTATYGTDFIFAEKNGLVYDAKYKTGSILIPEGELFGYIPLDILQRKGNATYIVLEDSEDARANRPTSKIGRASCRERVLRLG